MGQMEIYEFLKAHPNKWFTCKEIVETLNVANKASITSNLKKLRDNDDVDYKKERIEGAGAESFLYKAKKEE